MVRLIDADNVISVCEILSEKGDNPHYWGQLISIIEDMPIIDAIPVEWLEEQRDKLSEAWDEEWHEINGLIEQWREGQEART